MHELTDAEKNVVEKLTSDLVNDQLFEDLDFPACVKSITDQTRYCDQYEDVVWMRPSEICTPESPELFVNGVDRSDVIQGELSDCWFLSACASMAQTPGLIDKVLPPGQELHGPNYKGLITFRFWRVGEWETVHIDDRLPTRDGKLIFARCNDSNEFWLPLLEKAYAKFQYAYVDLNNGELEFAFVNLTGHMIQKISLRNCCDENDTFLRLVRGFHNGSYLTCGRNTGGNQNLVRGHAYTITHIRRVPTNMYGRVGLVRVRNPWGNREWTGDWRDDDPKWQSVDECTRQQLGHNDLDDGEFWMSFSDFVNEFENVVMAAEHPDFNGDYVPEDPKKEFVSYGSWKPNETGEQNLISEYAKNPQYQLVVRDTGDSEACGGEEENSKHCNTVLEVIQDKKQFGAVYKSAISVYKMDNPEYRRFTVEDFEEIKPEPGSTTPEPKGYLQARFTLHAGTYVVVICIAETIDNPIKFVLRGCTTESVLFNALPAYSES